MISANQDYRAILRDQLNARQRANPRYSLRAFARDLDVSPSRISELLNGKQGISRSAARKVARQLAFSPEDASHFCDLVERAHARSRMARAAAEARLQRHWIDQSFQSLRLDVFEAVSEWYHFAILQLSRIKGFRDEPAWIARRLGIRANEAQAALDRLERLGMIERGKGGGFKLVHDYVSAPDGIPSEAILSFHRQVLEKAISSVTTHPANERDFSAIILPIDTDDLPSIQKTLKTFRRKLCRKASSAPRRNEVYCLAMQFFRMSEKEKS